MLRHGAAGETYNVPGGVEHGRTATIVRLLLEHLGKPWSLVRQSRTGRATTGGTPWTARSSRRSAGGRGRRSTTGLAETVDWYVANEAWWRAARSGDWDAYYERQYGAAGDRPPPSRSAG